MALAYGFTAPVLASYATSQALIQSIPPDSPPLLQLPYFTPSVIKSIENAALSEARRHLTVQAFMNLPEQRKRELVSSAGLSPQQYETAIGVASQLPRLVVERTFFKVHGEKYIIPSSLVQFVIKARFIPPGTKNIPDVKPSDLEDIDEEEFDKNGKRKTVKETKQHQPPLAHAPYFPRDHSPRWHLFLGDTRQGKIAVPPFTFTTFDKPILDEAGKPTFAVQTLKMQFQAPPQPGQYKFQMQLVCDSYIGFDEKREVVLNLDEPSKAEEVAEDDDISEPEEGRPSTNPSYGTSHMLISVQTLLLAKWQLYGALLQQTPPISPSDKGGRALQPQTAIVTAKAAPTRTKTRRVRLTQIPTQTMTSRGFSVCPVFQLKLASHGVR